MKQRYTIIFFFILIAAAGLAQHSTQRYAAESVLSAGTWYKIATHQTGVHIITYNDLAEMGIDVSAVTPGNIRIYGNGNGMIPEANSIDRPDDLLENAIQVVGEDDGVFNAEDYILFFGHEPTIWRYNNFNGMFEHQVNLYTDDVYFFLTTDLGPGKRVEAEALLTDDHTHLVSTFSDYAFHEEENISILKTGKLWYGEEFKTQLIHQYSFHFPYIDMNAQLALRTNIAARSTENSFFHYSVDGNLVLSAEVSRINVLSTVYAWSTTPNPVEFYPAGDEINLEVEFEKTSSIAMGWMNYIELNARRNLVYDQGQLLFRDHHSYGNGNIARFEVSNANAGLKLWDVTEIDAASSIPFEMEGQDLTFKVATDELRQFVLFDETQFLQIEFVEQIENQNLHAFNPKDFIIISHPLFFDQSIRLVELHAHYDNLSSLIATPDQIYNEFSSGSVDPGAIRDFCKMLYEKADSANKPRYLLLFGDGSYDPKDRHGELASFIPAYQSKESLKLGYSFVTDDFYGLYDPNEGNNAYAKSLDIGIGRLPAHTIEQAKSMVDKIENYISPSDSVVGDWRNQICFVADDEDNNTHFKQAEQLAGIVDTMEQVYNLDKIYLDAYTQISTPAGFRYPEVNAAINKAMDKGSLIFNYTGHGGEQGLSHEGVLDIPMITTWTNTNKLPLFIAATCEFSRFDDHSIISAGEWVLLNPDGGGIGLLTTTRLAWSDPNFKLNKIIYEHAFKKINGEYPRLGDLIRISKTIMNTSQNVKNFVLLGDPALQLAYPKYNISTDSIITKALLVSSDTMEAMAKVTVHGKVIDADGNHLNGFDGYLIPTVYDKKVKNRTLGNDQSSYPALFELQNVVLFKGKSSIKKGLFSFSFVVPKDIAYQYGLGKISYYAYDTVTYEDAHGFEKVTIGGVDENAELDYEGPEISLFINNMDFVDGGLTDQNPVLLAFFKDEQGVNTFGNGIGHELVLYLDEQINNPIYMNECFLPDADDFQSGRLIYPFHDLEDGLHTLRIKAWDVYNNPSEAEITFYVSVDGQLELDQAYNYPNPFTNSTVFQFYHNKPGNAFDIEINIYNVIGQLVSTLRKNVYAAGTEIEPIEWNGTGNSGEPLQGGVYVYTMKVTDNQGTYRLISQKLVIAR